MKKECDYCKNCKEKLEDEDHDVLIDCKCYGELHFPAGSVPTCNKWEEKDPTLKELRDEVRELKKELRERRCTEIREVVHHHDNCCHDCCKCKCRCNRYAPYYPWNLYYQTYPNSTAAPLPVSPTWTVTTTSTSGGSLDCSSGSTAIIAPNSMSTNGNITWSSK